MTRRRTRPTVERAQQEGEAAMPRITDEDIVRIFAELSMDPTFAPNVVLVDGNVYAMPEAQPKVTELADPEDRDASGEL